MTQRRFPIISAITGIACLLWFTYMHMRFGTTEDVEVLYKNGAIFGLYYTNYEFWRLITPLFVHIGLVHLGSNLLILWSIGPAMESIMGHIRFALVYFLSGMIGNIFVIHLQPFAITAGASGAIFGLFGYLLVQHFRHDSELKSVSQAYIVLIIANIIYTFVSPNISIPGHIGGLIGGIILGVLLPHINTDNDSQPDYKNYL